MKDGVLLLSSVFLRVGFNRRYLPPILSYLFVVAIFLRMFCFFFLLLQYTPFYANSGFYYLVANEKSTYFAWSIMAAMDAIQVLLVVIVHLFLFLFCFFTYRL